MDILNVIPGSFSDEERYTDVAATLHHARAMVAVGANLIDVGGKSTRPNSTRISADEERTRIYVIVRSLVTDGVIVSVDMLHTPTARETTRIGATIINDVSGGRQDPEMDAAVTESSCAYIVQRCCALPGMPGEHFDYGDDLVGMLIERVGPQVYDTIDVGMTADKVAVDPGLGFSPTGDQCWQILRELPRSLQGGCPVLVDASHKRFVKALDGDVDTNSVDIAAYYAAAGAWAVRVHGVAAAMATITRKETDVD